MPDAKWLAGDKAHVAALWEGEPGDEPPDPLLAPLGRAHAHIDEWRDFGEWVLTAKSEARVDDAKQFGDEVIKRLRLLLSDLGPPEVKDAVQEQG